MNYRWAKNGVSYLSDGEGQTVDAQNISLVSFCKIEITVSLLNHRRFSWYNPNS